VSNEYPTLCIVCRDGILAYVRRVPYLGLGGGEVFVGQRILPNIKPFEINGPDMWNLEGFWLTSRRQHSFDLLHGNTPEKLRANPHDLIPTRAAII
jgi:hypothetical protein